MKLVTHDKVKSKIIKIRNQNVLLDSDIAKLYGIETHRLNEAVKRNPKKFPDGYLIELTVEEQKSMISKSAISSKRKLTNAPKAYTERGLYMLATILKSPQAINTTIAIIDTFTQFKNLTGAVYKMADAKSDKRKLEIFENSTDLIADLLDNELIVSQKETSFKLKLPFFEVTRKITQVKNTEPGDKNKTKGRCPQIKN